MGLDLFLGQKVSEMEMDNAIKSLSSKDKPEDINATWLMMAFMWSHLFDDAASLPPCFTYFSNIFNNRSALSLQENMHACLIPRIFISFLNSLSVSIFIIFSAISLSSNGLNRISSYPAISGRLDLLEVMTAAPHAIASRGGRPKPSCIEGKTNRSHKL